jgi:hypothetical protein
MPDNPAELLGNEHDRFSRRLKIETLYVAIGASATAVGIGTGEELVTIAGGVVCVASILDVFRNGNVNHHNVDAIQQEVAQAE